MGDSEQNQRKTLRSRVTKKVNKLNSTMITLPIEELQADFDILRDFQVSLKELDDLILNKCRADSSVTTEQLEKMEDDCDDYSRKIKVCMNKINVQINSLRSGSIYGTGAISAGTGSSPNRSKIKLPTLELPEFWADELKDRLTCKRFFENFEHLTLGYDLNETERFNLLEKQCKGRAKAMISSLNENYNWKSNF